MTYVAKSREEQLAETIKGIKLDLRWYCSCAGAVSRDDMDSAIRSILKKLRDIEELLAE